MIASARARSTQNRVASRCLLIACVGVASSLCHAAIGAEAIWSGGDGLWTDGSRWSAGVHPDDYSWDVIIDGKDDVASRVEFNSTGHAGYLTLDEGDSLAFTVPFRRMGINNGFQLDGRVLIEPDGNGQIGMNGGTIDGGGRVDFAGAAFELYANDSKSPVTIGAGITVSGTNATFGGPITHHGTMVTEGPDPYWRFSGTTNHGTIQARGGSVDLRLFRNLGTLRAEDTRINLGAMSFADLGNFERAGSTMLRVTHELHNAGQTIALSPATGDLHLVDGGSIVGGRITAAGDARFHVDSFGPHPDGNLRDVTLATPPVMAPQGFFSVAGTLTLENVEIDLSAGGPGRGTLWFVREGGLAGNGRVILPDAGNLEGAINVFTTRETTIGPGIVIGGARGLIVADPPAGHFVNEGTIRADAGGGTVETAGRFTNRSVIEGRNGGSLELGAVLGLNSTLHNEGGVEVDGGGTLTIQGLTNTPSGTVRVRGGGLTLISPVANDGVIEVSDAPISIGGTFKLGALGTISRSGDSPLRLIGTLDNAGATFAPGASEVWTMQGEGRINGGTLDAGTQLRIESGVLEHVTVTSAPEVLPEGVLGVQGMLELQQGITLDLAAGAPAQLQFLGTANTIAGDALIVLDSPGDRIFVEDAPSFGKSVAIESGITIRGIGSVIADARRGRGTHIVNDGTIAADVPGGVLTVQGVRNEAGTLAVRNGATLVLEGNWSNGGTAANTGKIELTDGRLNLGGSFTTAGLGQIERAAGPASVVAITGTLQNAQATLDLDALGPVRLEGGGRILDGSVVGSSAGGGGLLIDASGGVLEGVRVAAPVSVRDGAALSLRGEWSVEAPMSVHNATLDLGGTFSTAGLTNIHLQDSNVIVSGTLDNGSSTLTLPDAADGSWSLAGGTILGGIVTAPAGAALRVEAGKAGTLDGVELRGDLHFADAAVLAVENGLTLHGELAGKGRIVLRGETPTFLKPTAQLQQAFTIPTDIKVESLHDVATVGDGATALVNLGTLEADGFGNRLTVTGTSVRNEGTVRAIRAGELTVENSADLAADGTLLRGTWHAGQSGTLRLAAGEGVRRNAATIVLDGGNFYQGVTGATSAIAELTEITETGKLWIAQQSFSTAGAFSNRGELEVGQNATFTVTGPLAQVEGDTLTGGTWRINRNSSLVLPAGVSIANNEASVTLNGSNARFDALSGLLANRGSLALLSGALFQPNGPFSNAGDIELGWNSRFTAHHGFTSDGTIGGAGTFLQTGGTATIAGAQDWQAGASVIVTGGSLRLTTDAGSADRARLTLHVQAGGTADLDAPQHLAKLDVEGIVRVTGSGGLLRTPLLSVGSEGTLDLGQNDAIVAATPAHRATLLAHLTDLLRTGRNGGGGAWQGKGITSSAAAADPLTGLALVLNPGLASFGGEPVDEHAILIKYTYNGDANLDGFIDADDYFRIDSGFLAQPEEPTYAQGDFNYDGLINADDYFLIDSAFLGQGAPLGGTNAVAAVGVPEPGIISVLLGVAVGAGLRRRRGSSGLR